VVSVTVGVSVSVVRKLAPLDATVRLSESPVRRDSKLSVPYRVLFTVRQFLNRSVAYGIKLVVTNYVVAPASFLWGERGAKCPTPSTKCRITCWCTNGH